MSMTREHMQWYALRVRSNQERIAEAVLNEKGYHSFLPLHRSTRRWSDRTKVIHQPVFPGYLFCEFDVTQREPVVTVGSVIQVVGFGQGPTPVDATELEQVRAAIGSGMPITPCGHFEKGQPVQVQEGPLAGLKGAFVRYHGVNRLVLTVSLIQRSILVELDAFGVIPTGAIAQRAAAL
jgi:transcription antitermination factor NusG